MKPKKFVGELRLLDQKVRAKFLIAISIKGIVKVVFDSMPRDDATQFILDALQEQEQARRTIEFTLTGRARDGSTFRSDRIVLKYPVIDLYVGTDVKPIANCLECQVVSPAEVGAFLGVKAYMRGVSVIPTASADCRLGTIKLHGPLTYAQSDEEALTGTIAIQPSSSDIEFAQWRSEVNDLIKHVSAIMSFARGARLAVPVIETTWGGQTELTIRKVLNLNGHGMAPFTLFNYGLIFRQAVASHFFEGDRAKKIGIAIEWFTMPSYYLEAQLTSAMTVLENLLTTNLADEDLFLRNDKLFRKNLRKPIFAAALDQFAEPGSSAEELKDLKNHLCGKLNDLNRRSLKDKIISICRQWCVSRDGISDDALGAAKNARDCIVHQGQYSQKPNENLEAHIRLIRELIIRLVLAALEFEGTYESPLGGQREFKRIAPVAAPSESKN